MSRLAKPKVRQPSIHSRAARRATSPSLAGNVDKSLKDIQPPKRNSHSHLFSGPRDGGIKKKKSKQLKRGQLERQRRGVERADIVKGQLESKLEKSLGKLKTIKDRRKDWDVLNADAGETVGKASKFAALESEAMDHAGWEDVPNGDDEEEQGGDEGMKTELPVRPAAEQHEPAPAEVAHDEDVVE